MNLEERLQYIQLRLKHLKAQYIAQNNLMQELKNENKELKEEIERVKKSNFELKNKIDIADIANQFGENQSRTDLKYKVDKYIREVDAIINELKK